MFKRIILTIVSSLTLLAPALVPIAVHAQDTGSTNPIQSGVNCGSNLTVNNGACPNETGNSVNQVNHIITLVINVFSVVVGIIAVIMIIVGGIRFILSGGDSAATGAARNTVLYAVIGLVIVALAQIVVHFVLNRVNTAVGQ